MNDDFLRNFYRIYRPKGLLTRDPGEPPETFEQLQQRALERERAERANPLSQREQSTPEKPSALRTGASPRPQESDHSGREEKPGPSLEKIRKAENAVREIKGLIKKAEADVRRWEAQERIHKDSRIPLVPNPFFGPVLIALHIIHKLVATPRNLKTSRKNYAF
jgi:hypothetical protein|tara:strand:- start:1038 stop:1529 length:492 start_codon:yes stop_codon:yes gene_type:complete